MFHATINKVGLATSHEQQKLLVTLQTRALQCSVMHQATVHAINKQVTFGSGNIPCLRATNMQHTSARHGTSTPLYRAYTHAHAHAHVYNIRNLASWAPVFMFLSTNK